MLDTYRDLIDELLGTPTVVRGAVGERETVPAAAAALIASLRDRDRLVLGRLQAMMREPDALLPVLGDAVEPPATNVAALLDELDNGRGDLVSLLMNLTLKDWERTATHEVDGEISLAEEVERHVEFDERRRDEIEAALGGVATG